jgi:coenzyme F420-reducing hydrogenase delta subunit
LEDERIKLKWISASEGKKFAEFSNEFTEKVISMGENKVKNEVFL